MIIGIYMKIKSFVKKTLNVCIKVINNFTSEAEQHLKQNINKYIMQITKN